MKVQYLISMAADPCIAPGDVREVEEAEGARLIEAGFAFATDATEATVSIDTASQPVDASYDTASDSTSSGSTEVPGAGSGTEVPQDAEKSEARPKSRKRKP